MGEILRSFLLSRHYFAISTASGFIRNVASIVVILVGFHRYGPQSIFLGYLAGYLLQLAVLGFQIVESRSGRDTLSSCRPAVNPSVICAVAGTAQLGERRLGRASSSPNA